MVKLKYTYFLTKKKKVYWAKLSEMGTHNILKAFLDTFKPYLWFQKVSNFS